MNNVNSMTLPNINIEKANKIINKESKHGVNPFKAKLEKIIELRIYLNQNFHKINIDDNFLADLDQQYARQYLEKVQVQATKDNIKKLLSYKPVDRCDFTLTVEQIRNKPVKLLHIFPNPKGGVTHGGLKSVLSNEEFEKVMNTSFVDMTDDKLTQIKKREVKREEMPLYLPEMVDNLFNKAKEDIQDKKLYIHSHGMIDQHGKVFDLSIETIKKKYIDPNSNIMLDTKQANIKNPKAKFHYIDSLSKKDLFNDENYFQKFLDFDINKEILKEVNKPVEIPIEVLMKDINFILDNLPIDQLINLDEPLKRLDPLTLDDAHRSKINEDSSHFIKTSYTKSSKQNEFHQLKQIRKKDLLYVYKQIQSAPVYRILGILINLLYWVVFGFVNRIQVDKTTKAHMLFKILEELQSFELTFSNKKTFDKVFMPVFILIIRIECEAIFHTKFKSLFVEKSNSDKALAKINEIITTVFDPNSYFNTFTLLSAKMVNQKVNKNLYPSYKSKINANSNFVNQIFLNTRRLNMMKGKTEENATINIDDKDWKSEINYICDVKKDFYKILLNKINKNLIKRKLNPIFEVTSPVIDEKSKDVHKFNEV